MVEEWSKRNVASPLFKQGTCDWGEWNARFGLKVSITEGSRAVPFEQRQFIIRQTTKFGRTDEQAKNLWVEAEASNCRRDYLGFQGQLRLWLHKGEFVDKEKTRYLDQAAVEGSSRKKSMKNKDRDALRMHVHELDTGFGHEFFHGQSNVEGEVRIPGHAQSGPCEDGEKSKPTDLEAIAGCIHACFHMRLAVYDPIHLYVKLNCRRLMCHTASEPYCATHTCSTRAT